MHHTLHMEGARVYILEKIDRENLSDRKGKGTDEEVFNIYVYIPNIHR